MSRPANSPPTIRILHASKTPTIQLAEVGSQRVLLGGPGDDGSPMLMGITLVRPGQTSALIKHDSAEICYVLSGAGSMITDRSGHDFQAGDAIVIDQGCWHGIRAGNDPVEMLYVFPTALGPITLEHSAAEK